MVHERVVRTVVRVPRAQKTALTGSRAGGLLPQRLIRVLGGVPGGLLVLSRSENIRSQLAGMRASIMPEYQLAPNGIASSLKL